MIDPASEGRYRAMVEALRGGRKLPEVELRVTSAMAGRDLATLALDVLAGPGGPMPGDPCPECGGRLRVVNSRRAGNVQVRHLACTRCGRRAGKQTLPAAAVRRRVRK
jgi:hypothetical protein